MMAGKLAFEEHQRPAPPRDDVDEALKPNDLSLLNLLSSEPLSLHREGICAP